jgi:hypothetical protein
MLARFVSLEEDYVRIHLVAMTQLDVRRIHYISSSQNKLTGGKDDLIEKFHHALVGRK